MSEGIKKYIMISGTILLVFRKGVDNGGIYNKI